MILIVISSWILTAIKVWYIIRKNFKHSMQNKKRKGFLLRTFKSLKYVTQHIRVDFLLQFSLLLILVFSVRGIKAETSLPSLYLGSVELGSGVDKDKEAKVRNGITIGLIQKYKDRFRIIDDDTVKNLLTRLKIQQQTGCSTEKCEQMIDDALNADYKITGNLSLEGGGKLRLNLKLFRFKEFKSSLDNTVERSFTTSQLEYYTKQLAYHLVDSKYAIDDRNAPPEIELGKVDLSKISIKQVAGSDLKIIEFKTTDDDSVNSTINQIKPILDDGDKFFKSKEFQRALEEYNAILKVIKKTVSTDKQFKFSSYVESINKRIEQAYTNIYSGRVGDVDAELSRKKDLTKDEADEFVQRYNRIRTDYDNLSIPKNSDILNGLTERIEKLDLSNFSNQEKLADSYYASYKFTPAIREYKRILDRTAESPIPKPTRNTGRDWKRKLKPPHRRVPLLSRTSSIHF